MTARQRLALAIRRTNVAFGALPESIRQSVSIESITPLEREVDLALAAGDDRAALTAVEAWEREALRVFAEVNQ